MQALLSVGCSAEDEAMTLEHDLPEPQEELPGKRAPIPHQSCPLHVAFFFFFFFQTFPEDNRTFAIVSSSSDPLPP